ncbi:MAG: ADP-ribosylglycohydrolase family protein [Candidatus Sumerlaeia bacterium]
MERLLWKCIGKTRDGKRRYTDDTRMSLDLAEYLIENQEIDQDELARKFADSYRWSRGYGPAAGKLLKGIRRGKDWSQLNRARFSEGSFGNGAAMRAPVVGLFCCNQPGQIEEYCRLASEITHAHPLAIDGAIIIAHMVRAMLLDISPSDALRASIKNLRTETFQAKMSEVLDLVRNKAEFTPRQVSRELGNKISAIASCPAAIYIALFYLNRSFEDLLDFVRRLGGDTDTIAAMAGAIWGARNGIEAFDEDLIHSIEDWEKIRSLAKALYSRSLEN